MTDAVCEYAARYGPPDPEMSWGLFVILARRCGRFDARDIVRPMLAQVTDDSGPARLVRQSLIKTAGYG